MCVRGSMCLSLCVNIRFSEAVDVYSYHSYTDFFPLSMNMTATLSKSFMRASFVVMIGKLD